VIGLGAVDVEAALCRRVDRFDVVDVQPFLASSFLLLSGFDVMLCSACAMFRGKRAYNCEERVPFRLPLHAKNVQTLPAVSAA
jgi:hypothetical protein